MNLNQVTILTQYFEPALEFYSALGLRLIVDSAPRYARFECPDGESTFSLHASSEKTLNNCAVIYFECENVDTEYRRLRGLGIEFDHPPVDQEWLWREARLLDPDGNPIILFTAGSNRKDPPWKVSS